MPAVVPHMIKATRRAASGGFGAAKHTAVSVPLRLADCFGLHDKSCSHAIMANVYLPVRVLENAPVASGRSAGCRMAAVTDLIKCTVCDVIRPGRGPSHGTPSQSTKFVRLRRHCKRLVAPQCRSRTGMRLQCTQRPKIRAHGAKAAIANWTEMPPQRSCDAPREQLGDRPLWRRQ
jgi:hypothetical protein